VKKSDLQKHKFDSGVHIVTLVILIVFVIVLQLMHSQYVGDVIGFMFGVAGREGVKKIGSR